LVQTTIILSVVAIILIIINKRKNGKHVEGLDKGLKQFMQTAPMIIGAFILAGIIEVLIPEEFVQNWLSTEAGLRGVFLGTLGGVILAMGPYAFYPIAASILASGAGLATTISMITAWCLLGLLKMPFETAFLGVRFFSMKFVLSIPFSLIAGLIALILENTIL